MDMFDKRFRLSAHRQVLHSPFDHVPEECRLLLSRVVHGGPAEMHGKRGPTDEFEIPVEPLDEPDDDDEDDDFDFPPTGRQVGDRALDGTRMACAGAGV